MRVTSFHVENFRNLKLAEYDDVPDFMVICGGNGCGKSALLEALMTAKEHAGAYGNFRFDPRAVSVDSSKAMITMQVTFSEAEQEFVQKTYGESCPDLDEIVIEIDKAGGGRPIKRSRSVSRIFSYYSRARGSPGYFDYISAQRQTQKVDLKNWDASYLSDETAKRTLAVDQQKFQMTKQYLAGLKMNDLQAIQSSQRSGKLTIPDSLAEIRELFDRFFAPLKFVDVHIDESPFQFIVATPVGEIDIDDMSSGEKEILNIFVRFHQLRPNGAVILLDEADSHLHPDLERRYLEELRTMSHGNQLILTTHSPEMMIAAGSNSLFTLLKEQKPQGSNQLTRVTHDDHLHAVLSEMMGSRGLVSFNQTIVFIEGGNSSADRAIYEELFPPSQYNISFVPAGDSSTVRKTAERVNELLTSSIGFQRYFSIVDRDIERSEPDPTHGARLFRLPAYHVENYLLDETKIYEVTKSLLGEKCKFASPAEVVDELQRLLLEDGHVKPFTRALFDSRLNQVSNSARQAIFSGQSEALSGIKVPSFSEVESEARSMIEGSKRDGSWKAKCKGRDLLKSYCGSTGINYEHFRNLMISRLDAAPPDLEEIIAKILA